MASLDLPTCKARLAAARVARLATVTDARLPHVVPCCFVLDSSDAGDFGDSGVDRIYSVVDGKPKSTAALKRLDNIRSTPAASLVADHYADDWAELWWVRADGVAAIVDQVESAAERNAALDALAAKYDQYRTDRPEGALLRIDVDRLTGWSFSEA